MKRTLIFALALIALSCNDENVSKDTKAKNLMNLNSAHYWVYEWYEIDIDGNETAMNKKDSVITILSQSNGEPVFIKNSNFFGSPARSEVILFDSANTIYSLPDREVVLSVDASKEFIREFTPDVTLALGYYSFENNPERITVPAGSFNCVNFRGRIEPVDDDYPYGVRYNDNWYAEGVGLVKMVTHVFSKPESLEMRLVRHGKYVSP